jgi:hypothetical protein
MTDTSRNQNNRVNTVHKFLRGNPMQEKTTKHILYVLLQANLQVINFQLNKHPPIADNEDTNPLRHQHVIDMRTPILSGTN